MLLQIFPWSYNCLVIFSVQKFGKMVSLNKKKETHVVSWWNLYCGQVVLLALLSSLVNNSQLGSDMKRWFSVTIWYQFLSCSQTGQSSYPFGNHAQQCVSMVSHPLRSS